MAASFVLAVHLSPDPHCIAEHSRLGSERDGSRENERDVGGDLIPSSEPWVVVLDMGHCIPPMYYGLAHWISISSKIWAISTPDLPHVRHQFNDDSSDYRRQHVVEAVKLPISILGCSGACPRFPVFSKHVAAIAIAYFDAL